VLSKVKKHLEAELPSSEFAVIVRTNREVEAWTDFFQNNNIPVESKLRADILSSRFVKLFLNLIKTIQDPHKNDAAIISLLRSSLFEIDKVDVLRLTRALYKKNYTTKWKLTIFDYLSEDAFSSPKTKEITESDQLSLLENLTKTDQEFTNRESFISFRDLILDFQSKSGEMDCY
jgi:ATP-dependent exoDNAse (exonuclease V) beta subunit